MSCTQALQSAAYYSCLGVKVELHLVQASSLSHSQTTIKYEQNLRKIPHRYLQNMQTGKVPVQNYTCNFYGRPNITE